ncbi:MAG: hypothetical protein HOE69_00690 [Euryarchaeota archaeon]|nr:hypothetical protein [Euryarchaeota archaeon]
MERSDAGRLTSRQKLVYEAIKKRKEHPSAQTIHTILSDGGHDISMATVYRQLTNLVERGIVQRVDLGNDTRYCPGKTAHAHFHCNRCDNVTNVLTTRDIIHEIISSSHDNEKWRKGDEWCFSVQIVINGICDNCCGTRDISS